MGVKKIGLLLFVFLISCASAPVIIQEPASSISEINEGVELYQKVGPSAVVIVAEQRDATGKILGRSLGSGVCVLNKDNHSVILTAGHCYVEGFEYSVINFDGKILKGIFFNVSETDDLGLIWVDEFIPAIRMAEAMPERGSVIYSLGNKLSTILFWCNSGIYCGSKERKFDYCTIATHPGNSGGGIYYRNKLIGITSRIAMISNPSPMGGSPQILPTMSFFVPLSRITAYLIAVRPYTITLTEEPKPLTGKVTYVNPNPKPSVDIWRETDGVPTK